MDYKVLEEKMKRLLDKTNYVILATASKDGVVTSSKMCMVADGMTVYFQTDASFEKARNISENPNIAITIDNIYFKGQAQIVGHPSSNELFVKKMQERHFKTYENYTNLPNQVLIEAHLTECRIWGIWPENKEEAIKVLDLKQKKLSKIKCDNLKGGY